MIITITYKNQTYTSYNYDNKMWTKDKALNDFIEEIEQELREEILDDCLGWEKALEKEDEIFTDFENNRKIKIKK